MKNNTVRRKTIAHVVFNLANGGTEKYLLNLIKATNKNYRNIVIYYSGNNELSEELDGFGVEVHRIADRGLRRVHEMKKFFKENKIDVVYAYSYLNSIYAIFAAFLANIKIRITHSHREEPSVKKNKLNVFISRLVISLLSTDCLACSRKAGETLFLKRKFYIIENGIDLDKYKYNQLSRDSIRKKLGVKNDELLLGGVGRIDENKNQIFMIKVLESMLDSGHKCKLAIVGDGDYSQKLKNYVRKHHLTGRVIFTGNVKNANDYYNAFDAFLLTSFREGMPFVLIEACANGLQCFVSEAMDGKIKGFSNIHSLPLEKGANFWGASILKTNNGRADTSDAMARYGYSIENALSPIMRIYEGEKIV